jgi:hypothetical protein
MSPTALEIALKHLRAARLELTERVPGVSIAQAGSTNNAAYRLVLACLMGLERMAQL